VADDVVLFFLFVKAQHEILEEFSIRTFFLSQATGTGKMCRRRNSTALNTAVAGMSSVAQ
jgi:hypothetical protein